MTASLLRQLDTLRGTLRTAWSHALAEALVDLQVWVTAARCDRRGLLGT